MKITIEAAEAISKQVGVALKLRRKSMTKDEVKDMTAGVMGAADWVDLEQKIAAGGGSIDCDFDMKKMTENLLAALGRKSDPKAEAQDNTPPAA